MSTVHRYERSDETPRATRNCRGTVKEARFTTATGGTGFSGDSAHSKLRIQLPHLPLSARRLASAQPHATRAPAGHARGLERVELPVGEVEQLVEGARSELGVGDAVEHAGTL